jgi:hypothetical protein
MRKKTMFAVVGIVVVLGLIITTVAVYAQAQPGGFQGGGGGRGGGGPGGGGGSGMMGRMMGMMRGGSAAIAVSGESVYVVYMGTLFKFNADTLEEEGQAKLEVEGMQQMMQQMMNRGGGGGAPGAPGGGRVNDGTPPPGR